MFNDKSASQGRPPPLPILEEAVPQDGEQPAPCTYPYCAVGPSSAAPPGTPAGSGLRHPGPTRSGGRHIDTPPGGVRRPVGPHRARDRASAMFGPLVRGNDWRSYSPVGEEKNRRRPAEFLPHCTLCGIIAQWSVSNWTAGRRVSCCVYPITRMLLEKVNP